MGRRRGDGYNFIPERSRHPVDADDDLAPLDAQPAPLS